MAARFSLIHGIQSDTQILPADNPSSGHPAAPELSALAVVLRLVNEGLLDRARFGRIRFHGIEASPIMEKFPVSSKLNNYAALLEYLFDLGRQTGDAWLAQHEAAIGQHSTIDLQQLLPVRA